MCLKAKMTEEESKALLDSIEGETFTVYKVARVVSDKENERGEKVGFYPLHRCMYESYEEGLNEADTSKKIPFDDQNSIVQRIYFSGFHFYKDIDAAEKLYDACCEKAEEIGMKLKVIECQIEKSWITEFGFELAINVEASRESNVFLYRDENEKNIVLVTDKAIFPKFEKEVQ